MNVEAGEQPSATLVLGHTFSDQREIVADLIAQPVEMRVMRWAGTKVPLTFDEERRETDVPVGFIVASFGAGQLTDVPRGRRPYDGVHSFRIDSR